MKIPLDRLPTTLDEAVDTLIAGLDDKDREQLDKLFKEKKKTTTVITVIIEGEPIEIPADTHFTVGRFLRNNWNLWEDSPISRWFIRNLKLAHADDMSGILLEAFEAKYLGKEYDPSKTVAWYRKHWEKYYGENSLEKIIEEWKKNHNVEGEV